MKKRGQNLPVLAQNTVKYRQKGLFQKMAGVLENLPNFLHKLAGKLGQDLATLPLGTCLWLE